jgi:hypothetical protein
MKVYFSCIILYFGRLSKEVATTVGIVVLAALFHGMHMLYYKTLGVEDK